MRTRAAFVGAVMVFCVGWAGVLALLLKRGSLAAEPPRQGVLRTANGPASALWQAAREAGQGPPWSMSASAPVRGVAGNGKAAARAGRAAGARVRALVVEHDDMPLAGGTVRHLLRATVPAGLSGEQLRRCIDLALDEERMKHPQVDSVSVYLYEEAVYARYTGRATPLGAAVAFGVWAPGGEWANPGRAISGLDNRVTYNVPNR